MDGYDEISLTDDAKIITKDGDFIYSPEYLGKRTVKQADIGGGNSVEEAAKIFVQVLEGRGSWSQNAVVFANAAIAIRNLTGEHYSSAFAKAIESLESGKALSAFKKLMSLQK
jgi:anthranilate phosphoribosyltransferase